MPRFIAVIATRVCIWTADSSPMRWIAEWNARVNRAYLRETFGDQRATLSDVLPWAAATSGTGYSAKPNI
jgi:hypothetical protein